MYVIVRYLHQTADIEFKHHVKGQSLFLASKMGHRKVLDHGMQACARARRKTNGLRHHSAARSPILAGHI